MDRHFNNFGPLTVHSSPGDLIGVTGRQAENIRVSNHGKQALIASGNESFDSILGGGLLLSTLNLFELSNSHTKPFNQVLAKSFSSSTLSCDQHLVILNYNSERPVNSKKFVTNLPSRAQVNPEKLNKDLKTNSISKIKIAWRYRDLGSPSDKHKLVGQIDFGSRLFHDVDECNHDNLHIIEANDFDGDTNKVIEKLVACIDSIGDHTQQDASKTNQTTKLHQQMTKVVTIIVLDSVDPLSCLNISEFPSLLYKLRSLTRAKKNCTIIVPIYPEIISTSEYPYALPRARNIADGVIELSSFIDDENSPYPEHDGILKIVKLAKVNSVPYHYERDVCDWGFRQTKDRRYYVFDRLSLPPAGYTAGDDKTLPSPEVMSRPCASSEISSHDDF